MVWKSIIREELVFTVHPTHEPIVFYNCLRFLYDLATTRSMSGSALYFYWCVTVKC
jgi:hypothetical protein